MTIHQAQPMPNKKRYLLPLFLLFLFSSLSSSSLCAQQRIVSLSGAISEMLCALSLEPQIVGVDVTSNYPASLQQKPKVGHNRTISAEGILALRPTLVLGIQNEMKQEVIEQLTAAKIKVQLLTAAYSADGTRQLLQDIAQATGTTTQAAVLRATFDKQLAALKITPLKKKSTVHLCPWHGLHDRIWYRYRPRPHDTTGRCTKCHYRLCPIQTPFC
ncbi:heme/hemin ABC transporter substrate-binding protein [Paraflavitalea speifideaquila]|uniref:heme/hemin ABC transporter substrate-binding protein n=1 Tax=Paraflavitalea speifideaquila TaxID=3076558 RepID=UPI0028E1DE69|nr:ABC transporter substrate-binding protein [Paraflavitalea speifideiaquila]